MIKFAKTQDELRACQRLRHACFYGGVGIDQDAYDPLFQHLMLLDTDQTLRATVRLREIPAGHDWADTYTGSFYKIAPLALPVLEIGRLCVAADTDGPDALREVWAGLTQIVDRNGIGFLVGCASFAGTDPQVYQDAFADLATRFQIKDSFKYDLQSTDIIKLRSVLYSRKAAQSQMPNLLRSYLTMGGLVSDHAVIDRTLGTMHVLTMVEIAAIPAARARTLRVMAAN